MSKCYEIFASKKDIGFVFYLFWNNVIIFLNIYHAQKNNILATEQFVTKNFAHFFQKFCKNWAKLFAKNCAEFIFQNVQKKKISGGCQSLILLPLLENNITHRFFSSFLLNKKLVVIPARNDHTDNACKNEGVTE